MTKYFVVSDIHGYYDELIKALTDAGFDKDNKNHVFIGCGDYLDRGRQPIQVMDFINSLPRKILIKGNHESLIEDCLERKYPNRYDWSNGTAESIIDLVPSAKTFEEACVVLRPVIADFVKQMVDYHETKNYIFVHSWIPVKCLDGLPMYYTKDRNFTFDPDWRYAHHSDWEEARWGNPYDQAQKGLFPDKTIVFGHWHCSTGWAKVEKRSEFGDDAKFDIFYGDKYISIDACTAISKKCNVLVIDDEEM